MSTRRIARWAAIEYQPNLQRPTDPVRLGVVVEEVASDRRIIVLLGRVPIGSPPELQLGDAWGPFRDVATGWFEATLKDIREITPRVVGEAYVVDELANKWRLNLYLRAPEEIKVTQELLEVAKEQYAQCVQQTGRGAPGRKTRTVSRRPKTPWRIAENTAVASLFWPPRRGTGPQATV